MSAHISVTGTGMGNVVASAELNVDNNPTDFVDLSSGDALVATSGSTSQTLGRSDLVGIISYSATFMGPSAADTTYTVALNRTAGNVSAPSSTCTLPALLTLAATPAQAQAFSRLGDDITVTWSPNSGPSDSMDYVVSGSCLTTSSGSISGDPGTFTIPRGTLVPSGSPSCAATLTITRKRSGHLDPAYGYGGDITCGQAASLAFTSNP